MESKMKKVFQWYNFFEESFRVVDITKVSRKKER